MCEKLFHFMKLKWSRYCVLAGAPDALLYLWIDLSEASAHLYGKLKKNIKPYLHLVLTSVLSDTITWSPETHYHLHQIFGWISLRMCQEYFQHFLPIRKCKYVFHQTFLCALTCKCLAEAYRWVINQLKFTFMNLRVSFQ